MAFPKGLRCDLVPVCAALQVNPLRKDSQKLAKLPGSASAATRAGSHDWSLKVRYHGRL